MKYFVLLVIAASVVAGFAYRLIFSDLPLVEDSVDDEVVLVDESSVSGQITVEEKNGVGTLNDIGSWTENVECSIKYTSAESKKIEGTYFIADGNIRGDFLTPSPDFSEKILSSMIINGASVYVWSEINGDTYGVKLDVPESGVVDSSQLPVGMNVDVRYSCKSWQNVDRTIFNPPSSVLFRPAADSVPTGMEYGTVYEEGELPL